MLNLIGVISNSIINTSSFEKKMNSLLNNERKNIPSCKKSFFYGTYYSLKSISNLYNKLNNLPYKMRSSVKRDLNETLSNEVLSLYLSNFEENLGINIKKENVNMDNIEDIFEDLKKEYRIEDMNVNYESFMKGVQEVVIILKNSFYHPINKKYQGFVAKFAEDSLDSIIQKLIKLKKR